MVDTKSTRYLKSDLLTTLAIYTLNEVINVMKDKTIYRNRLNAELRVKKDINKGFRSQIFEREVNDE